ncbi:MAG: hypothetical protein ACFFC3_00160 [Candidatus Odinarchaeota archaeon]
MGKYPYCSKELHIEDFFVIEKKETKRGSIKTKVREFKGESILLYGMGPTCRMWVCPSCKAILGFSEWGGFKS